MKRYLKIFSEGWFSTIRTRLAAVITFFICTISIFIFAFFPAHQEKLAIKSIDNKAHSITQMIAYSLSMALSFSNHEAVEDIIESAKQNKDLVYLILLDNSGNVFTAFNRDIAENADYMLTHHFNHFSDDRMIYRTVTSIISEDHEIGELYMGFSLEEINAQISKTKTTIALVSLLVLILGMLAAIGLSTLITRPLSRIIDTVERIAKGDLTQRASISSNDEVGNLAKSLNTMVDNLESAQQELAELNQALEERVKTSAQEVKEEIIVRRRAEKALRLTQFSIDHAADLLFWIGQDARFYYVNETACHILGYSREELLSMTVYDINPDFSEKNWLKHWEEVEQRGSFTLDSYHKTKEGGVFPVEVTVNYIEFEGKQYICAFARDITERKKAEEELISFAAKLEKSNRELQDFAYVASHDLQEPLRKVQAFGDRLKAVCADELSEKGRDYLNRMQSAAERMQILIKDLLTFSRITSKAQPFTSVDLHQIAKEVLSDLEVVIEQLNGQVELSELPVVDADPLQMRQLLQNLISNALKFHKKDEAPVIKIYSEIIKEKRLNMYINFPGEKLCRLVVEDNGIGFDEKYCDKIFTVFQRLHGRSEYEGTGVGLAVCRKIIERHSGTITAKSKPGRGAKFFVTIPLEQHKEEKGEKKKSYDKKHHKTDKIEQQSTTTKNMGDEQSFMVPCP